MLLQSVIKTLVFAVIVSEDSCPAQNVKNMMLLGLYYNSYKIYSQ